MATLVLTAAGAAIGGPTGAAIGAFIGQRIDAELFKGKGREGPRLNDLRVQTSSYDSAIAKVFGTIRVAGCVIWSTDLIEAHSTAHHKGQPSVTIYSYAASFAVLLSGRAVVGVGRIWADGNLLRGAAGDFKATTGFRLHLGGEDQPPDPLIASIEGAGTPAHRGCAYAVFENLALGDFGNRIPSLTFELIADAAPVGMGAIAEAVAGGAVVDGGVAATLDGFSAYGSAAREVVTLLATASGARFVPHGGALAMTDGATGAVAIADDGFTASGGRAGGRRTIAAIERVPRSLSVAYYDAARDYQIGSQRARRPGAGSRDESVELPAVLGADAAKALAETLLRRAEIEREQRTIALSIAAAGIAPGALVTLADDSGTWRVTDATIEAMVTTLTLVRLTPPGPVASAAPGRALPAPDLIAGATILRVAELPALGDTPLASPRLLVMANGTAPGWRRAALVYSLDGGASWRDGGASAAPAAIGTLAAVPGMATATLVDRRGTIEVELARADMVLADADDDSLDRGANLALVGDELIQFGRAEQIGPARWRVSELWRGRRGTEGAIGTQTVGDRFVLLAPDAAAAIDLPVAAIGSSVQVLASGIGDSVGPVAADLVVDGASIRPPSPAQLRLVTIDGTPTLIWARRSRAGFRWIDGGDVPLVEESEAYRVTIAPLGGAPRNVTTTAPTCPLDPAEAASGTVVAVRQVGTLGESAPATLILP